MFRLLKVAIPFLLVLCLVNPAMAQYYKAGKDVMVKIIVRYDGPDTSPYIARDKTQIALKEATAGKVRGILESVGAKVGYSFRHVNLVSASIPVSRLGELSKYPDILEVAKDKIWEPTIEKPIQPPTFNPFKATPEERKAWMKQKAQELKQRIATMNPKAAGQRAVQAAKKLPEMMAKKNSNVDAGPAKPLRISGVNGTVDPQQVNALLSSKGVEPANYSFYNHGVTNAATLWNDADKGSGTIVAVIDSGTYSAHPLLSGSVIGGEVAAGLADYEASIDLDGDGVADGRTPAFDSIINNPHGTGVACMVAGHGSITFSNSSRFLKAVKFHAPASVVDNGDGTSSILIFGTAPGAKIYAIKVFPYPDGGTATSIIFAGIEAAIDKKVDFLAGKSSGLNITVANMSLGGPNSFAGFSAEDKLVDSMVSVGIQPVVSAGNSGPAPYTISEPGDSLKALTVAAASERIHHRIAVEAGFPELNVGDGAKMRMVNQFIPAQFSSHGPLPTGYGKPDLTAEGTNCLTAWLFDVNGDFLNDVADVAIVGGTSFSAPTTAGGVALLQAWAKAKGLPSTTNKQPIKAALMAGARPLPGMDEDEVGKGFLDLKGAADYLAAHPDASAGPYNTRKLKFKGKPFYYAIASPSYSYMYGFTDYLKAGEQDDFLIPTETAANDESFYRFFIIYGINPTRSEPFPGVVRDIFDPIEGDGIPARAALFNNTEIFYADGINTGFGDGDYILSSLNMVDTYLYGGPLNLGFVLIYPELFPNLTLGAYGFLPDPDMLPSYVPITNFPSGYASGNPTQQFGSGGRPDYDRLSFIGDNFNDNVSEVRAFVTIFDVKRSAFGLTAGTPSFSSTIQQNVLNEHNITLPAPVILGYFFRLSFPYGWNNYKFPSDPFGVGLTGIKRKTADLDMYITRPDGSLLNLTGFEGLFQGASLNDVEGILDLNGFGGKFKIEVFGFDVKGLPNNTVPYDIRIWDFYLPIIP